MGKVLEYSEVAQAETNMEVPGVAYLYTLANLSMTFVGFTAIVLILRQALGHHLSRFDVLLARIYMEVGAIVTGCSLLPPLLIFCELPLTAVWRLSSLVAAFLSLLWVLTYPGRRRAATGERTPLYVWVRFTLYGSVGLSFLVNASGFFRDAAHRIYGVTVTVMFFINIWAFLTALNIVMRYQPKSDQ